ncbi:hypothetical protein [Candidatus Electrothrix sp.]|uniref:hypothetical protein n=1 Tax=Candidatus Electrothrix sp. TaxID=2170559 RepID=UPI0040563C3E
MDKECYAFPPQRPGERLPNFAVKFRFTLLFFALSSVILLSEVFLGCDLIEFIYTLHSTMLDQCLSVAVLIVTGLVIDYINNIKRRKEREKAVAYNAAVRTTNYLLRGVMSNMIVLSESKSVQEEFGYDITEIMKGNIEKIEEILEGLSGLKEITPEMIREISQPKEK